MQVRPIVRTTRGIQTSDGAGVRLRRLMGGGGAIPSIDPFLMLDYFDSPNARDYIAGFPEHPHRGFETVTYMLNGRMRHRDNHGGEGVIEPGGIQWMTAGRGLVHSEMPEQSEGLMRGFQLWVNLPARLKMSAPGYQEHGSRRMPVEDRANGVRVKVIAGETSSGTRGPVTAEATQPIYFDIELPADGEFVEPRRGPTVRRSSSRTTAASRSATRRSRPSDLRNSVRETPFGCGPRMARRVRC